MQAVRRGLWSCCIVGELTCRPLLLTACQWPGGRSLGSVPFAQEILSAYSHTPSAPIMDLTFGDGHHTKLLLDQGHEVLALDRDPSCETIFCQKELHENPRFHPFLGKFSQLPQILLANKGELGPIVKRCSGILLDLGHSTRQIKSKKGFNFEENEPLDLRMSNERYSGAEVLQHIDEDNLVRLLRVYGRVKRPRLLVTDLIEARYLARSIRTTEALREMAEHCFSSQEYFQERGPEAVQKNISCVFLALRMFVNDELNELKFAVAFSERVLKKGSIMVVILRTDTEEEFFRKLIYRDPSKSGSQTEGLRADAFEWKILETHQNDEEEQGTCYVVERK